MGRPQFVLDGWCHMATEGVPNEQTPGGDMTAPYPLELFNGCPFVCPRLHPRATHVDLGKRGENGKSNKREREREREREERERERESA